MSSGADKTGHIGLDAPRVTEDAALELAVHHLQMAHMYFQAAPDNRETSLAEVSRLLLAPHGTVSRWVDDGGLGSSQDVPIGTESPDVVGSLVWWNWMEDYYAKLKLEHP